MKCSVVILSRAELGEGSHSRFFAPLGLRMTFAICFFISCVFPVNASEVLEKTAAKVVVREHPKTGISYVSIVSAVDAPSPLPVRQAGLPSPLRGEGRVRGKTARPDYRMLDPKFKGKVPYEGPASDRTKVYAFAAALAAAGTAASVAAASAIPATTAATAAGGAGAYAAAGAGVITGTAAAFSYSTHTPPEDLNFTQDSQSILIEKGKS